MQKIDLNKVSFSYDIDTTTFLISEKDVTFDTDYEVTSRRGNVSLFKFTHSTGPEFSSDTKYVYKNPDGIILEVANDSAMCKKAEKLYLEGKLRK